MNDLYRDDTDEDVASAFIFDNKALQRALKHIYEEDFHPMTEIEESLFNETFRIFTEATDEGISESGAELPVEFRQKIDWSNAVFSAFKVHRMQNDIATQLFDSNGDLKPFEQWKNDVHPMLDHHVKHWLRTEYDTAVIRSRQAADWQRFEQYADILPNLEWMPSTSANPGADHIVFWGTILPINHPFWSVHRPGDRWNCKCSLSSTDEEPTPLPDFDPADKPQDGLENNPGKDARLFSDKHPYMAEAHTGAQEAVDALTRRINEMIAEMPGNLTYEEKKAIAMHNLELEKVLGITKPMSVEEADKQNANPKHTNEFILDPNGTYQDKAGRRYRKNMEYDREKARPYNINCQTCAPAYALRLKGFDITAKGNVPGSKLEYLSKGRAFEVWKNADGTTAQHTSINGSVDFSWG